MVSLDKKKLAALEQKILLMRDEKFEGLPEKHLCFTNEYIGYHSRRFATLALILEELGINSSSKILDVGPTFTALFFHRQFGCTVDALSFSPDEETPFGFNYQFDLNDSQFEDQWREDMPQYPVVVFAEVIEHLYTAPEVVLKFLASVTEPGGVIICQTPNPLALRKRIQLLAGRHPFEEISLERGSPNHYRESTLKELVRYGQNAGLEIAHAGHYNYFNPTYRQNEANISPTMGKLFFKLSDHLPGSMKPNCMVIYRKKSTR